ncbi:MAG TPA: signal recognition particle receptor subunit alpha, partial [Pyrinomonadaceae bacterium]
MAFWRRKKDDRYITLGLNQPAAEAPAEKPAGEARLEPPAGADGSAQARVPFAVPPAVEPVPTGAQPAPQPSAESGLTDGRKREVIETPRPAPATDPAEAGQREQQTAPRPPRPVQERPAPARSSSAFSSSSSILGLNRTEEELRAEIEALEATYAARFTRAIAATRESLSEKIDSVFENRKQIDAELLDELEEALIAADLGVPTTLEILDKVRRGISRKEIGDIAALKLALKTELLGILRDSERKGVASEERVDDSIVPYVIMVVGVNGVGKTTTIGKLAQRIKAEGNDVLICAADTFR